MYTVNIKRSPKEGTKPVSESWLVAAINFTDVEVKLNTEFKVFAPISCKASNYVNVFETGDGSFFKIKLAVEDIDGKLLKEEFIQEATDNDSARNLFGKNVDYGTILDVVSTNIIGVIR
jgi:hypothetical protein